LSDWFYNLTCFVCRPAFTVSHCPVILHKERLPRRGAFILVPNHLSQFDVPCLMAISPRNLDFVSVTELFRNPWVARFFTHMNAFPLDRHRVDTGTTRTILDRLHHGRAVVIFPEGHIRPPHKSVLVGGAFNPAVIRIAQLTNAPIVPCVILGTSAYRRRDAWFPLRQTRYGINFGLPEHIHDAEQLRQSWLNLSQELQQCAGLPLR
jgi:1-acyl-sn-glycerol-3-phosphate acyltransferase